MPIFCSFSPNRKWANTALAILQAKKKIVDRVKVLKLKKPKGWSKTSRIKIRQAFLPNNDAQRTKWHDKNVCHNDQFSIPRDPYCWSYGIFFVASLALVFLLFYTSDPIPPKWTWPESRTATNAEPLIAGAFTHACLHPLDTIKTKMQMKGASEIYKNALEAAAKTFHSNGFFDVVVGSTASSPPLFTSAPANSRSRSPPSSLTSQVRIGKKIWKEPHWCSDA